MTNMNGRSFTFILMLVVSAITATAQTGLNAFMDIGSNSVSGGLNASAAGIARYSPGKYNFSTGIRADLRSNNENFITGFHIKGSRAFIIKDIKIGAGGFFNWSFYSGLLRIADLGATADMQAGHIAAKAGINFKTYSLTDGAIWYYDPESVYSLNEKWNMIYSLTYRLKRMENKWNAGITLTNIDWFLISQVINPSLNLNGSFRLSNTLSLFGELWFKNAGAFNSNVNYFGFFIRTGIIWEPGFK